MLKKTRRPLADDGHLWRDDEYQKTKKALAEDGDGLGKDFIKSFLPKHAIPGNETLQNAINSYYGERRKAAAEARAAALEAP